MRGDLQALYQEVILDHNRHPRNFHTMVDASRSVEADNPLCGDWLRLYLKLEANHIIDISFEGTGCAISMASVSMLTKRLKGESVQEAQRLFEAVHELLTCERPRETQASLDELEVLKGVCNYPMRVKCATLSWHALKVALEEEQPQTVTTE